VRPEALLRDGKPDPIVPVFPGPRRALPMSNMVMHGVAAHEAGRPHRARLPLDLLGLLWNFLVGLTRT
jgi:hypothetical protein